ncbi:MAG: hypothetical protein ACKV2U_13565, partial [Bryobacteraceae bacterium]
LHNRHFPSLDDVITAVETEFDQWASRNETLRRLCRLLKTLCIAFFGDGRLTVLGKDARNATAGRNIWLIRQAFELDADFNPVETYTMVLGPNPQAG